jgi:hypothetical protein
MFAATSVQNFLYVEIESKWYKTVFSLVVCVGVKLGLSRQEKPGALEDICAPHPILLDRLGARDMWKN